VSHGTSANPTLKKIRDKKIVMRPKKSGSFLLHPSPARRPQLPLQSLIGAMPPHLPWGLVSPTRAPPRPPCSFPTGPRPSRRPTDPAPLPPAQGHRRPSPSPAGARPHRAPPLPLIARSHGSPQRAAGQGNLLSR
jgi:hypothetical protein